ncbi:MAG TPA: ABC transporter permease [Acidimicrobiales bacterium]|nr:ABC transporter permease [Acidimicrobiales bacterium]
MADSLGGNAVASPRELAHIYRKLAGARIRADWQYRGPFIGYTLTQGLITFLDFVQIAVIFNQVDQLAGWSVAEVAFLYGASSIAFHVGDAFISQCERAPQRVKSGEFDLLLIRPVPTLFHLCADDFAFRRFGKLIQSVVVFATALVVLDIDWSVAKVGMLVVMLISGTAIFAAVWVTTSAVAMWMIDATEIMNSFTYGSSFAAQYPLPVMAKWLRHFLTFVVPAAFVSYFPALFILDKPDPFGTPAWIRFAGPAVAVVLMLVARTTWSAAIRHYRSTGS